MSVGSGFWGGDTTGEVVGLCHALRTMNPPLVKFSYDGGHRIEVVA